MELNVMIPNHPSLDFFKMTNNNNNNNNSTCNSPYISAPSSPQKPINFFYSAPSSPTKFNDHFSDHGVAFEWEYKPGVPKSPSNTEQNVQEEPDNEFEFEFSGQLDRMVRPSLSSADELFVGGKIRPLKPPPVMISTVDYKNNDHSPRSPMSKFKDAISPKNRRNNKNNNTSGIDPFENAIKRTTTNSEFDNSYSEQSRGRSKNISNCRANSRKGISRSLSPLRVSEFALHQQELVIRENNEQNNETISNNSSTSSRWGSRKWRLKDFLLFRSASEGSATTNGKDPLKYKKHLSIISTKKSSADDNEGSFRSNDGSVSRRRGSQVSAHERHYMKNRLVSEEQKKKTPLPYKPGLLACLGFNPALHDITKAFGSFNYP